MIRKIQGVLKKAKEQNNLRIITEAHKEWSELLTPPSVWAKKIARIGFKSEIEEVLGSIFTELLNAVDRNDLAFNRDHQTFYHSILDFVRSEYCDFPKLQRVFNYAQTIFTQSDQNHPRYLAKINLPGLWLQTQI